MDRKRTGGGRVIPPKGPIGRPALDYSNGTSSSLNLFLVEGAAGVIASVIDR
jgi:hypothetical protein